MDTTELAVFADEVSTLLKAIAHPGRFHVLCLLLQGEMTVSALKTALGIPQSSVSYHLARLHQQGLVNNRRIGLEIRYSLSSDEVLAVFALLHRQFYHQQDRPIAGAVSDTDD